MNLRFFHNILASHVFCTFQSDFVPFIQVRAVDPDPNGSSSVADPDPHNQSPPRSGSAWTDADPDPGGKKA